MKLVSKRISVITTTAASTDTFYSTGPANGLVHAVVYTKSTSATISSSALLSITGKDSGRDILTSLTVGSASYIKYIRESTVVDTTNGTSTGAMLVPIVDERIKVTIGNSSVSNQLGTFDVILEGA